MAAPDEQAPYAPKIRAWRTWRMLPLAALVLGFVLFFVTDLHQTFSFDLLARHHDAYKAWVGHHPLRALVNFIGVYVVIVAFSLPLATLMTIAGGFLFGPWLGTIMAVIGATVGATVLFAAAKTALGDILRKHAHGTVRQMEEGFRKHAFNYLLVLRLVPAFPFFLVNIVPALLDVPLRTFVAATALGIVPATVVYTSAGVGLETAIEVGAGTQPCPHFHAQDFAAADRPCHACARSRAPPAPCRVARATLNGGAELRNS